MNATHDDSASSWRDLIDQLTSEQIAHAERLERVAPNREPGEIAAALLEQAREHARQNLNDQLTFGHLPAPAGARRLWHWERQDESNWEREFEGTEREFRGFQVLIRGTQTSDGRVDRCAVTESSSRGTYTAAELRSMATLLVEAADEIEQLHAEESK